MLLRNWIELAFASAILVAGIITKCITRRKCMKINGFKGINKDGPGQGWKVR